LEAQNTKHDYSTVSAQTARKQSTLLNERKSFTELKAIRAITKLAVQRRGIIPIRQKQSRKIFKKKKYIKTGHHERLKSRTLRLLR